MIGYLEKLHHGRAPIRFTSRGPGSQTCRRSVGNLVPVNRGSGEGTKRAIAREIAAEEARQARYSEAAEAARRAQYARLHTRKSA